MKNIIAIVGFIGVLTLFFVGGLFILRAAPTVHVAGRSDACFMAQKFVRQNLKAPTTATFPDWTEENCSATQAGDSWTVNSFVDAQNSFGAMIRSDYTARMTYHPVRDTWTLTGLSMVP